jgi:hypothetical protein
MANTNQAEQDRLNDPERYASEDRKAFLRTSGAQVTGDTGIFIQVTGNHHNKSNPHDINQLLRVFVDDLKAKGHNVKTAIMFHADHEDMLHPSGTTRSPR